MLLSSYQRLVTWVLMMQFNPKDCYSSILQLSLSLNRICSLFGLVIKMKLRAIPPASDRGRFQITVEYTRAVKVSYYLVMHKAYCCSDKSRQFPVNLTAKANEGNFYRSPTVPSLLEFEDFFL